MLRAIQLKKPSQSVSRCVELYHDEFMQIDSTSTVQQACGGCHNLSKLHPHEKLETSVGGGINFFGVSGSASISQSGMHLTVQAGQGIVVGAQATIKPHTGPHITQPSSGLSLSGGLTSTTSAEPDNTRVR